MPYRVRNALRYAVASLMLVLAGCHEDKVVRAPCQQDSDCEGGQICDENRCTPPETKSCDVVINGNPILQPMPHSVAFGELDKNTATQSIALHNIGNCTLTVFEAALAAKGGATFTCPTCQGGFPIDIFPGRSKDLEVAFNSDKVGKFEDQLVVLSDDQEFPELRVPVRAHFLGIPDLRVAPSPIDFGYVAQGRQAKKQIQVTNQGTGVAPIVVESIELVPNQSDNFSLATPFTQPVTLIPVATDPKAVYTFELQYHPRATAKHMVEVVIKTSRGNLSVVATGNAETPPKMKVSPTALDLGRVPLGQSNFAPLTITNEGGAPLTVSYAWGGTKPSTDLFTIPKQVGPVEAGQYVEIQVGFTATGVGPVNGLLVLSSNSPSQPSVTIPVTGEGVPGPGPQVVKVEMYYENGSDTAFDADLRNVDMTLEHPFGYVCNKANPKPTNWGNYGNPTWISFGIKEEPERIVLADAITDGTYRVMLQYSEDCASLPTELLAGLLGISVDALVLILTGGLSPIPGKDIGKLIENVCLSKTKSNAMVKVYVNGTLSSEKTITLSKKGDFTYALDLVRSAGVFTVR